MIACARARKRDPQKKTKIDLFTKILIFIPTKIIGNWAYTPTDSMSLENASFLNSFHLDPLRNRWFLSTWLGISISQTRKLMRWRETILSMNLDMWYVTSYGKWICTCDMWQVYGKWICTCDMWQVMANAWNMECGCVKHALCAADCWLLRLKEMYQSGDELYISHWSRFVKKVLDWRQLPYQIGAPRESAGLKKRALLLQSKQTHSKRSDKLLYMQFVRSK